MTKKLISIVVPLYNEEGNLIELYKQLVANLKQFDQVDHEIIFVNDGSTDNSLAMLKTILLQDQQVKIVNFARNFGHEIAMTAGLDHAKGEAVIFMDADLQHPPSVVPQMIQKWLEGYDIVLTRMTSNEDKGLIKSLLASSFYKVINLISDVRIPEKMPDFRLIGQKYIQVIKNMRENGRMFRGMLNWLGMINYTEIEFAAPKRFSGKSNYNFTKSFKLAFDSILQFSIKPLRISIYVGIIGAISACLFAAFTIYEHFANQHQPSGYATLICLIVFISGIQFIVIGIIGEYVGRIHIESKQRPLYFAEVIENDAHKNNAHKNHEHNH
jgi:glycosyltransferase involved in cell wall biosynthesis